MSLWANGILLGVHLYTNNGLQYRDIACSNQEQCFPTFIPSIQATEIYSPVISLTVAYL